MPDKKNNSEYITISFDDGTSARCEVLGVFDANGGEYVALLNEKIQEVYFYRYIQRDADHYDLGDIETEEEFDAVSAVFDEITAPEQ